MYLAGTRYTFRTPWDCVNRVVQSIYRENYRNLELPATESLFLQNSSPSVPKNRGKSTLRQISYMQFGKFLFALFQNGHLLVFSRVITDCNRKVFRQQVSI